MSNLLSFERIAAIRFTLEERSLRGPLRDVLQAVSGAAHALVRDDEVFQRVCDLLQHTRPETETAAGDVAILMDLLDAPAPGALTEDDAKCRRLIAAVDVAHALYRLRAKPNE